MTDCRSLMECLESRALLSAAGPGTLDATFGHRGVTYLTNQTPANVDTVTARGLPGGKTLLVGKGVVSRLKADGALDTTYGEAGFVYSNLIDGPMDLDSRGRMIFASRDIQGIFHVSRFNANGTFDRALFTGLDGFRDPLFDYKVLHVLPDDSVLLGGEDLIYPSPHANFGIVKIKAHGGIDSTFGSDGKATTHFYLHGRLIDSEIDALEVDKRGRIVAAGGNDGSFDLARFNADGSLDSTFGNDGRAQVFGGGQPDAVDGSNGAAGAPAFDAIALRDDGEIFAAGGWPLDVLNPQRAGPMMVAAFSQNGKLDGHFGRAGVVQIGIGSQAAAPSQASVNGLAITPRGQLLLAGTVGRGGITGAVLARLNGNGSIDPTFGTALASVPKAKPGVRFLPFHQVSDSSRSVARSLILRGEGHFLVPLDGSTSPYLARLYVERFNSDGNPDTSFGAAGLAEGNPLTLDTNQPAGLVPSGSQDLLVATQGTGSHINRLSGHGLVSDAFNFSNPALTDSILVAVQPDGKALFEDNTHHYDGRADLFRVNPDGSLDPTYGTNGRVSFTLSHGSVSIIRVVLRPDGAMIVDVNQDDSGVDTDTLHLLSSTGNDLGSVNPGPGYTDIGTGSALVDFTVGANGDLYVLTSAPDPQHPFSFQDNVNKATRYNASDLTPDLSFGSGGSVNLGPGNLGYTNPTLIAAMPDGGVIIVRPASDSHTRKPLVMLTRLTRLGSIDPSFGQNGTAETYAASVDLDALLVQDDGKIILGSDELNPDFKRVMTIRRLMPDGTPDPTFGDAGTSHLVVGYPNSGYRGAPFPRAFFALQNTADGQKLVAVFEVAPAAEPRFSSDSSPSVAVVTRVNL